MSPLFRKGAVAAALASAVFLIASGIVHVPEGSVAVRSWRGGGTPTFLAPGLSYRIPVLQRVDRYDGSVITVEGQVAVSSREGSEITLPYRVSVRPVEREILTLSREGGAGGAAAALRTLMEERIRTVAALAGTYDLASGVAGTAMVGAMRERLQERFGAVQLEIQPAILSPEVRASFEREAIFSRRRETGLRVILIGIDGADWDFMESLIARGELPHFARLKKTGAWSRLRSSRPTLSPLLWTTVATGKSPDRHGINDFLVSDPKTGRSVPINSTFRKVKALWNILSEGGLSSDTVAWWATWPAEAVVGHLISDRVAYSTFPTATSPGQPGAVHPPDYAATVESLRVRDDEISYRQLTRFVAIDEGEFREARAVSASGAAPSERQESINLLVRVLAATETYRKIGLDLIDRAAAEGARPSLLSLYFQGIDEVNHRFAHCAPPRMQLCSDRDSRSFRRTVAAFYQYQDEILGEILSLDPDATVLIMSDHGFSSAAERPKDVKPFIEGQPGLWHDMRGIFIASGPGVSTGEIPIVTLYDIAPTILYLLGLPVPDDMPGDLLEAALSPEFLAGYPVTRVPTYELLGPPGEAVAGAPGGAGAAGGQEKGEILAGPAEEEILEQLRSLGYVGAEATAGAAAARGDRSPPGEREGIGPRSGPPSGEGVPTLLYYVNLGGVYLGQKRFDESEAEFRRALAIQPDSPQALSGLALVHEARGKPEEALRTLRRLYDSEGGDDLSTLVKMAELFARMRRPEDGLAYLEGLEARPEQGNRSTIGLEMARGFLQAASGRFDAAGRSFERALKVDPTSSLAMQELFSLYDARGRAVELEPQIRAALVLAPRSGMHHNWLGLVLRRRGDLQGAEAEFKRTLEVAPDLIGAMANLGSLYLQQGRSAEAVEILTRSLEKNRRGIESRVNLIVALGMVGNLEEARRIFEEAESMGQRLPHYHNAMAYALHVNGRTDEALTIVDRALAIFPGQPDALRLRREIEEGRPVADLPYR
jgi:tetratricopeptide (TPR) repeat protein